MKVMTNCGVATENCRVGPAGREGRVKQTLGYTGMSGGAYVNKPERRIRQLHDILTSGPRTFDAVVVGAGRGREERSTAQFTPPA